MQAVADGKNVGHLWNDSFRGVQQSGVFLRVLLSHNMKETRISGAHRIKALHQLSDHVSHFAVAGHLRLLNDEREDLATIDSRDRHTVTVCSDNLRPNRAHDSWTDEFDGYQ